MLYLFWRYWKHPCIYRGVLCYQDHLFNYTSQGAIKVIYGCYVRRNYDECGATSQQRNSPYMICPMKYSHRLVMLALSYHIWLSVKQLIWQSTEHRNDPTLTITLGGSVFARLIRYHKPSPAFNTNPQLPYIGFPIWMGGGYQSSIR